MRILPTLLARLWTIALAGPLAAQQPLADLLDDPAIQLSRPADLEQVVSRMTELAGARRQNARTRATLLGLPLRTVLPDGRVREIVDFDGDRPRYLTTCNANAAISTGANLLRTSPYMLSGSGVAIGLWDASAARSTHQEFSGRVTVQDGAAATSDHSTHVAGTLIAAGITAAAHGMAAAATIDSYDWYNDISEMTSRGATAANQSGKIYLSNHSYVYVSGWSLVNSSSPVPPFRAWEWNGDGSSATSSDSNFGMYNSNVRTVDLLAVNEPYYLIFRGAGNDRSDNPSAGQTVALSPGSTTVVSYDPAIHPAGDGSYRGGFDTIGFDALAKNVMTIGSVADAVSGGLRDTTKASISSFSSWGPTDDGRIKPDLVANGENLYSSLNSSDTAYGTMGGTSMATPNATGSTALLIQSYGRLFPNQAMRAATLKGLLIHTADDLGNPGPDYKSGWGLLNVQAAAALIKDQQNFPEKGRLTENSLSTTTLTRTHSFVWDGLSPISATLCWTDPAGTSTTTVDDRTARLVNNLNLKIIAPNGSEFLPFVMPFVGDWSQASMSLPATTGVNNTDNVEQVRIATPPAIGTYQAVVSIATLTSTQNYSLLISGSFVAPPLPPAPPANLVATPTSNTIGLTWSAATDAKTYLIKRSLTPGGPYTTIDYTVGTSYSDTQVIRGTSYYYVVSATNGGGESDNSAEVSVIPIPTTTSLASSLGTAGNYGETVTFTATVTPPATGSVVFKDNATVLATVTLNGSSVATYTTPGPLALGTHPITASYAGDATCLGSTSGTFTYTVHQCPVTIIDVAATTREYDATPTADLTGGTLTGVVTGETVTMVPGRGSFASANAGTQAVITTDYGITGTHAANYVLSNQPAVTGTITPRPIQLTGSRVYDGTAAAAADVLSITNNLDGAGLTLSGRATLRGRNAGEQPIAGRVQSATGNTGGNRANSFSVTMGSPPVAGNTLIAVISTRGTSASRISGITQTGAQWTAATQATNTNGTTVEIWFAPNVSPGTATAITINQASSLRAAAVIMEYAGVLATNPLDRTGNATGTGTTPVTGTTAATNQANELWIGGIGYIGSTPTLGTLLNNFRAVAYAQSSNSSAGSNASVYAMERTGNPATSASSGGTLSTSAQWAGAIATFKSVLPATWELTGPAAGNYTLTGASGSVTVTPKPLTVSAVSATKTYDGTSAAAGTPLLTPGLATGDTATGLTQAFQNSNAGAGNKVLIPSLTLNDGNGGGNYAIALVNCTTGTIIPATAIPVLGNLTPTYNGSPQVVTTTTTPPGLTVSVTYDSAPLAPSAAGSYAVVATLDELNYQGAASGTLVIGRAAATIALDGLTQTYDGTPKPVTATTTPANLAIAVTYNGAPDLPINAGSYAVQAHITDPNYQGTATTTLVITPGNDWTSWCNKHFTAPEQSAGLAADTADPDADGLPNLAEYALGTNPRAFTLPLAPILDANGLTLIFTRPASLPGVSYAAESSDSLGGWSPTPLEVLETGPVEAVRARDPLTTGNPARRFLRLRFGRE